MYDKEICAKKVGFHVISAQSLFLRNFCRLPLPGRGPTLVLVLENLSSLRNLILFRFNYIILLFICIK